MTMSIHRSWPSRHGPNFQTLQDIDYDRDCAWSSAMLSAENVLRLQREQYRHDQQNHFEIISMSKVDRMKHYGLHFAKYVGRLARGADEIKSVQQTIVDASLICLSAANTLNQKLFDISFNNLRLPNQVDVLRPFADASGRFADACEKIDHLEDFLAIARDANRDIIIWLVALSTEINFDLYQGIQERRKQLAQRSFYIENVVL